MGSSALAATRPLAFDELESLWRGRLQVARLEIDTAVAYRDAALSALQVGSVPTWSLLEALQKSELREQTARERYRLVLKAFAGLVLDGKAPEEEPPSV